MAFYKYPGALQQEFGVEFDQVSRPGTPTPYSGIYRCTGCGRSAVSTFGHPLPPQNHHEHKPSDGAIAWQLIVKTHYR